MSESNPDKWNQGSRADLMRQLGLLGAMSASVGTTVKFPVLDSCLPDHWPGPYKGHPVNPVPPPPGYKGLSKRAKRRNAAKLKAKMKEQADHD